MNSINFYKISMPIGLLCGQYILSKKISYLRSSIANTWDKMLLFSIINGASCVTNIVIYRVFNRLLYGQSNDIYIDGAFLITCNLIMVMCEINGILHVYNVLNNIINNNLHIQSYNMLKK